MSAVYHADAEEEEAWEEVDEEEAKQEAAPGEEAIRHLAPWDPESATPHTQEDQLIQDQLIHIREPLRRAGIRMAALELDRPPQKHFRHRRTRVSVEWKFWSR